MRILDKYILKEFLGPFLFKKKEKAKAKQAI